MTWLYLLLPFGLIALVLLGIGIYELIVETRRDEVVSDRMSQSLYLRKLDRMNIEK